ncbi:MAG: hypothetical protein KIT84_30570 [Labilithrix sp.]|nr:hypothetical protein [Labilithrix sp.]MCW5815411.1 hypothetical protein [Labilithrix sp.]
MTRREEASFRLDPITSSFVVDDYNWATPFSNFFPGIAGKWGVPLWLYYVNRGQAVSSFGARDKNGQILEFQSFNHAVARVGWEGFRTFLRIDGGATYEPFRKTRDPAIRQTMAISASELVLTERNEALGLEIEVTYSALPNLRIAGLARRLRVRDLGGRRRRVECVDGLPRILPSGLDHASIKGIPRHIEGMFGVVDQKGVPLFRLKQTPEDSERVGRIEGGHFYLSAGSKLGRGVVVDPEAVFGEAMSYERPWTFEAGGRKAVLAAPQFHENKTPCAFTVREDVLLPKKEIVIDSVIGYAARDEDLLALRASLGRPEFLARKRAEASEIVEAIRDHAFTVSASPAFDAYARYDFLDNVIRGGMPLVFETEGARSAFYLYSRQNGDLERDYHFFTLEPSYLSQGNGHYRSVLQNRRTDVWFFPETEDANLQTFLNLIQLDGYNPLEVGVMSYRVVDPGAVDACLRRHVRSANDRRALSAWMARSFTPGELVMRLEALTGRPAPEWEGVLAEVLAHAKQNEIGHLHEGFWADHWHYNVDLLELYLMVYPDRLRSVLLERATYTYFDDPDVVLPRAARSVDAGGKIRMYGAVRRDPEKVSRIAARSEAPNMVRNKHGKGRVYETSLLVKLLTIVVNRLATLDPAGTGVEMEGGKPGWNDSMNGLPGLFGSGLSEMIELRRTVRMLEGALARLDADSSLTVPIYEELVRFMRPLQEALRVRKTRGAARAALAYWDAANTLKEAYREETRLGVSGKDVVVPIAEVRAFLADGRAVLDRVLVGPERAKAMSPAGVPYTYLVNDVVDFERTGETSPLGYPTVRPRSFRQRPVRLFLEGAVHWMKELPEEAKDVYEAVRRSPIFDKKLRMYRSCERMDGESPELGRAIGAYPRGWIENESIYLHMEYKYLLEILRSGLCDEFWRDAKTALIPFMSPEVYGRSTLEGASFIVSSAYADARLHGRGFQPRLSGITCEFLHIWILAVAGEHPFRVSPDDELELALEPRLPGWLFTEAASTERRYLDRVDGWQSLTLPAGTFAFKLMNRALVVYHNAARRPTYGRSGVRPVRHHLTFRDGTTTTIEGPVVSGAHAHAVRDGSVRRIDVDLRTR